MIPSVVAEQLRRGLIDYVGTTFPFANEPFRSSFAAYLERDKSLCLEPYTAIRLPFKSCSHMPACFEAVRPAFLPYVHQQQAFDRLAGDDGRSTLVATGTGSGKTECFLYPILDYCYRHRHRPGIKALVVYPMNALASDQAGRIARLIFGNDKLRDNVTAGLYVGGLERGAGVRTMTAEGVITDRDTMIKNPPDILLTNYKMLDYLLMRPHDAQIWRKNDPDTLKYVAVDEMHTFDGAQGTDLACLIRRLKSRLFIQPGYLCCMGTSATMGGPEAAEGMVAYARELFGEPFDRDAVIQESRQSCEEFLGGTEAVFFDMPDEEAAGKLDGLVLENDRAGYLRAAQAAFFGEAAGLDIMGDGGRCELAARLKAHALFQAVMECTQGAYWRPSELAEALKFRFPQLEGMAGPAALDALAALVSHARTSVDGKLRPFLNVQVQFWSKELRRLVASVGTQDIDFDIALNLSPEKSGDFLPVLNCRDCGQTAWAGLSTPDGHIGSRGLAAFYSAFFSNGGENVVAVYPRTIGEEPPVPGAEHWYCPACGKFEGASAHGEDAAPTCPECDAAMIPASLVALERTTKAGTGRSHAKQYRCPCCGSDQGLAIMGMRDTTASEVLISQLFASGFDDDVRTLVFSDNVQDASHRAGFFNGRTWKFGLRAAMLEYLCAAGGRQSVAGFQEGFADFWSARMGGEEFVARFIAPGNTWMREYEHLVDTGSFSGTPATGRLLQTVRDRMAYEALLEVGMRAHIGRTLEKSAALAVEFEPEAVARAARAAAEIVANERGVQVEAAALERVVLGMLDRMRTEGAFDELSVYDRFVRKGANAYMLNHAGLEYLPSLHASGIPRFPLVSGMSKSGFMGFAAPEFALVVRRELPGPCAEDPSFAPGLVSAVLRACHGEGLLVKIAEDSPSCCSYAISRKAAFVTADAVRLTCDACGRSVVRAQGNLAQLDGAGCPSAFCTGRLRVAAHQGLDYYGHLFSGGLRTRVQAREHTGLLTRAAREEVEEEFKASADARRPWYPNVLSCTPTLEMGIDIGDLSSLVMCGMPPGQAQFLQRAGRAGRRDGNALSAVVANASPHGMYFFDEPREMIEGNVEAPRVFLEAGAVLERQFTAYCLDRWTKETGDEDCVPDKMFRPLQNMARTAPDEAKFPFSLLRYVKGHTNQLVNSFLQMFSGDFSADSEVAQGLRAFVTGDAQSGESRLHVKIYDAFYARMRLRTFYQEQKAVIDEIIKELKSHPQDSSYDEQVRDHLIEKRTVDNVIKSINEENVFGFMSREGLLPNYAFPEEGASLRVVLRRRKEDLEEGSKWERETQEFSRAASAAISEFAPGNTFYANGHHCRVDQIDLTSAKEEEWRLCPECSHAERITPETPAKACPKCHSTGWADKAQRRKMLRLATVVSNEDYNESLSDDSSDAREVAFFTRQLLVEVDERRDVVRAYRVKGGDVDFGFEYVRRATLREINCGPVETGAAQESTIAGESCARSGFQVCMKCGKVQAPGGKENHARYCDVARGKVAHEEAVEDCLFLYREFATEAVRMLIPETSVVDMAEGVVESFKAAVLLGLKRKFGNVDHLSMVVTEEPVPESGFRKRYLVIFDSVPGGTGYLKQLVRDGAEFMSVLRLAYDAMDTCTCRDDPHRDGCYRCLYAYRQSSNIGNISRRRAMAAIGAILASFASDGLEEVTGLDDVTVNNLFDSELEKLFVDALAGIAGPDGKSAKCTRDVVRGKPGYSLQVGDSFWEVEPQVDLGPAEGVAVACRPDFVLRPVAPGEGDERRPVAVFTDGFEYHKGKVADDTLKREAIRRGGRYRVWSLSYQDVECALKGERDDYRLDLLRIPELPTEALYNNAIAGRDGGFAPGKETPFSTLAWYLGHADAERVLTAHAEAYSLGMLGMVPGKPEGVGRCWELVQALGVDAPCGADGLAFAGLWQPGGHVDVRGAASREDARRWRGTLLFAVLDDADVENIDYRREWNGCLALSNLMQFFEGFALVAKSGLEDGTYTKLPRVGVSGQEASGGTVPGDGVAADAAWERALSEMLGIGEDYARKLMGAGVPAPDEVGFELETGEQADLAWTDRKICFLSDDLFDDGAAFEAAGWAVIGESCAIDVAKSLFGGK